MTMEENLMQLTRTRTALTALVCSAALAAGCGGGSSGGSTGGGGSGGGTPDGAALFSDKCSGCHGDQGQGGVGPNLQESAKAGDVDQVIKQITNGGGGMPAFGDQLSTEEIAAIADHVANNIHGG